MIKWADAERRAANEPRDPARAFLTVVRRGQDHLIAFIRGNQLIVPPTLPECITSVKHLNELVERELPRSRVTKISDKRADREWLEMRTSYFTLSAE